jgi:RimJ/RimL family protein N-acetyltransferase
MPFYPEDAEVPRRLDGDGFVLRPLRATDVDIDYEALMDSREMLRVWDQGDWPSDDFTREENLEDLERHEREHDERSAFTFTIVDPTESECLGCVYLYPLKTILGHMGADSGTLDGITDGEAYATFWVRRSRLADGLDERVLTALVDWFGREWRFPRVVFGSNSEDARQLDLFAAAGFGRLWEFPVPGRESRYVLFGR